MSEFEHPHGDPIIGPADTFSDAPLAAELVADPPRVRGRTAIAWLAIIAVTLLVVVGSRWRAAQNVVLGEDEPIDSAAETLMGLTTELQGKLAVGMGELTRVTGGKDGEAQRRKFFDDVKVQLERGPASIRLRSVVLAGELLGPSAALRQLNEVQNDLDASQRTPEEEQLAAALERLYQGYRADLEGPPEIDEADAKLLREQLGWFGKLALAPPGGFHSLERQALVRSAQTSMAALVILLGLGALLGCVGFVVLVTLLVLAANGRLASQLVPSNVHPGIYAETFAVWMILYVGLTIVAASLRLPGGRWTPQLAAQALSLIALAWPVLRGISWAEVRRDVGLTMPSQAWLEPLRGAATYALSLPLLGLGLVAMLVLMQIQGLFVGGGDPMSPQQMPTHPIVESVRGQSPWTFLQIFLLAAVGAPIVEEILFRGVLYRSLRDSSRTLQAIASILLSMAVSGFIFAVIHPQGFVAIPVLGALATGFAISREWRGTIWPAIIAHGINNGLVTILLFMVMGSG